MANNPQPIDVTQANDYILINRAVRARLKTWTIPEIKGLRKSLMNAPLQNIPADAHGFTKAENFINDLSNTFVFRREDFERFFEGDTNDPQHKDLKFTHIMVMMGALKKDETDGNGNLKKSGEHTVLIAGCTPLQNDPDKFITTIDGTPTGARLQNIATEHPPKVFNIDITSVASRGIEASAERLTDNGYLLAE